jgi:hypothetical protein
MNDCQTCLSVDCDFPTDLELYSLQGLQFFLNGQLYPVIYCPAGYNCNPFINDFLYFQCCNRTLKRAINSGMTYPQIQALVQSMYQECLGYSCGDMPKWPVQPAFFFNALQIISGSCMSGGGSISIFVSTAPAGMFVGPTQEIANAMAAAYAQRNYHQPCCLQSPRMTGNPGWCCLGTDLDPIPEQNTYLVGGPNSGGDFTFSVTGTLPTGTTLTKATANTAVLGGTPTTPGFYTYTVRATKTAQGSIYTEVTDTFAVFGITNPTGTGPVGTPFSQQLAVSGGTLPVTFSATPANLPAGLTMDSTGLITGTPTTPTSTPFNVTITDAEGGVCMQAVTITVTGSGSINWSTLVWGSFYNVCTPLAPYSAPSGTFSGANFSMAANGGGIFNCNDPTGPSAAYCDGTLTYNGPVVNGTIAVSASFTGAINQARVDVEVLQDGNPIITATIISGGASPISVPFTVADTGGLPSTITVTVHWQGGVPFGSDGSVNANGSIS